MKKTILEIYALAVCFATVVCTTVALGIALWDVLQIAKPEFTINNYVYERYQDNDSYWGAEDPNPARAAASAAQVAADGHITPEKQRPTEAEITVKREKKWNQELRGEQREGLQSLVKCLLLILVNFVVFMPHWILARRSRSAAAA